jgi:hypothetical protein
MNIANRITPYLLLMLLSFIIPSQLFAQWKFERLSVVTQTKTENAETYNAFEIDDLGVAFFNSDTIESGIEINALLSNIVAFIDKNNVSEYAGYERTPTPELNKKHRFTFIVLTSSSQTKEYMITDLNVPMNEFDAPIFSCLKESEAEKIEKSIRKFRYLLDEDERDLPIVVPAPLPPGKPK